MREPVSGLTHLAGAALSAVGLVALVRAALRGAGIATTTVGAAAGGRTVATGAWPLVAVAIFGASLILLYTASSLYHLLPLSARGTLVLRRLDHMMIYVLIAGTYTPFCLISLRGRGAWGWSLFGTVWGLALAGVILKAVWINAPRWLSVAFYLGMGWLVVVAAGPLLRAVPAGGLEWLAIGGLFYTVGAVFYATKWPRLAPGVFGFHELWHLFVMAGSFSHFWAVYRFL